MTKKQLRYMRAFLVGSSEFVIDDNATHERLKKYDILDRLNEQHETIATYKAITDRQEMELYKVKNVLQRRIDKIKNSQYHSPQVKKDIISAFKDVGAELGVELHDEILCYTCLFCTHKGSYKVDCDVKGHVDVHGTCHCYTKKELQRND